MSPCIWTNTRHKLCLTVALDWVQYQNGDLVLPPTILGKCTEWRFEVSNDETKAIFRASWDRRKLPKGISIEELDNIITRHLA